MTVQTRHYQYQQETIDALLDRMIRLQQAVDAVYLNGPQFDSEYGDCIWCDVHVDSPHDPECAWTLIQAAVSEAVAVTEQLIPASALS